MSEEKLLVVDDNPTNLKLIKVLLTLEGYDIRTATDVTEAQAILKDFIPDLILMDLQLPGMDGLEFTKLLKANPKYKETIIVALTAYAMKGDKEKALKAGCDGYIAKPISTEALPEIIKEYLKLKV